MLTGIGHLEAERQRRLGKNAERLINSPLLIRMLLVVHFSERRLPEQRAELYQKATDTLLLPEHAPDEEVAERIGRLVGGSREVHRELVQYLAFRMHVQGETQGREISEEAVRAILNREPAYAPLVNDFLALTRLRGTLLEERLGMYRFIHLAFQEYLVARYLAEVERSVERIVAFLAEDHVLDSWWREPVSAPGGVSGADLSGDGAEAGGADDHIPTDLERTGTNRLPGTGDGGDDGVAGGRAGGAGTDHGDLAELVG
ncbi:MAG: hypothetical protein V9G20_12710 [Candidatus Promineifilaceae bacterium]